MTTDLATDWKFILADAAPAAPTGGWAVVTVPHTWNAADASANVAGNPRLRGGYYRGVGWYARSLAVPADWRGRRVFIRFEAASIVAQVYLNGTPLGNHRGGFTAFCLELTPQLHWGQTNELRVRVDNSPQADVPPLSGDFNMDGGLYRPVELIVTDPVCITPLDFASPGVYEALQALDDQHARVEINRNKFMLVDQSTNGTFVLGKDGEEAFVRRDSMQIRGEGLIGLGKAPDSNSSQVIRYTCEE